MAPKIGLKANTLAMKVVGKSKMIPKPKAKSKTKLESTAKTKVDVAAELFGDGDDDDDDNMNTKPMKKPSVADDEVADKYATYPCAVRE